MISVKALFSISKRMILCIFLVQALIIGAQAQSFVRYYDSVMVLDGGISAGVSWGDYDNDGNLDLFVANWLGQDNYLYRSNGDGTFTKITEGNVVSSGGHSSGGCWCDYDNDGDLDLFVTNQQNQHNLLFKNNGDGTFAQIKKGPLVNDYGHSYAGAWGDYDNDGFADLYVSNSGNQRNFLYKNNGDGTFAKVKTTGATSEFSSSWTANWGDYNNDGYLDLFVPVINGNNELYENRGDGTFTKITGGSIVSDGGPSYAGAWGDYNNDGYLDLAVANLSSSLPNAANFLYTNNGDGTFTRVTEGVLVTDGNASFNVCWADFDNDGYLDLLDVTWNAVDNLYRNNGDGTFSRTRAGAVGTQTGYASGSTATDCNNDGFMDINVANWDNQNNYIFINRGTENHFLKVKLIGSKSNRNAIGARVVTTHGQSSSPVNQVRQVMSNVGLRSQGGYELIFGLKDAKAVDTITVYWPSGKKDKFENIKANQMLIIDEDKGIIKKKEYVAESPASRAELSFVDLLYKITQKKGAEEAIKKYDDLKKNQKDKYIFDQRQLVSLGYRLLGEAKVKEAIAIFKLNASEYPKSANALDSLAEAYIKDGNYKKAVETYRKVLEVVGQDIYENQSFLETLELNAKHFINELT